MNRRQIFGLAGLPALGLPDIAFASDWRAGFLQVKLNMLREIAETPGNHEPHRIIIHTCDTLLQRTDAQAAADKVRLIAMVNQGRAARGASPITDV